MKVNPPPKLTSLPIDIPLQIKEVAPGESSFSSSDSDECRNSYPNTLNYNQPANFAMIYNNAQLKRQQQSIFIKSETTATTATATRTRTAATAASTTATSNVIITS